MADIQRRAAGQFRARVRRRGHPARSATFPNRAEAEAWARRIEAAMDRGDYQDTTEAQRTTLGEALDRYLREVTPGKRGAPQERNRIAALKRHKLAARSLLGLRGADLAEYRDARLETVAASTVRLELAVLGHLFTIARTEWGMEGLRSPLQAIRKPQAPRGRDRRLAPAQGDDEGEEARLLAACGPRLRSVVILVLETAMRRGELAGLRWDQVDLERRVARLELTKNGDAREVPLSRRAVAELEALRQVRRLDGWVLGPPLPTAEWMTRGFTRAAAAAGCPGLRFHDLRHEATSRLAERGLGVHEIAAITGHKTLAMLARYMHLRAADLAEKLG